MRKNSLNEQKNSSNEQKNSSNEPKKTPTIFNKISIHLGLRNFLGQPLQLGQEAERCAPIFWLAGTIVLLM